MYLILLALLYCLSAEKCKCNINLQSTAQDYRQIVNDICSLCLVKNCRYDTSTVSTFDLTDLVDTNITYYNGEQEYFFGVNINVNCVVLSVEAGIIQYENILKSKIMIEDRPKFTNFKSNKIIYRYYELTNNEFKHLS